MQRYFIDEVNGHEMTISGEDHHHISRVMRMKTDSELICVTPDGRAALCRIAEITSDKTMATVIKWLEETVELPVRITIASGLPKGDKFEWIVQKGTELGANEFIPFTAARSVVKWDPKKGMKKVERWQKIAKEAAEQSHRSAVPRIGNPVSFKELIKLSAQYDHLLVAYEEEAKAGERSAFAKLLSKVKPGESILAVFGPEGGLDGKEIEMMASAGFIQCGLGPRILRAETAPLYMLGAASYHLELMR